MRRWRFPIPQPEHARHLRAVVARAQEPDRRQRDITRHRVHSAERVIVRKSAPLQQDEFLEAFQKIVGILPPGFRGVASGAASSLRLWDSSRPLTVNTTSPFAARPIFSIGLRG